MEFTLATDSIMGLEPFYCRQDDRRQHPIAYARTKWRRTSVTELETLAVVWAVIHFHSYPYSGDTTVLTDHSAV